VALCIKLTAVLVRASAFLVLVLHSSCSPKRHLYEDIRGWRFRDKGGVLLLLKQYTGCTTSAQAP